jgi:hypothetical protein
MIRTYRMSGRKKQIIRITFMGKKLARPGLE